MKRYTHLRIILFLILGLGMGLLLASSPRVDAEPRAELHETGDGRAPGGTVTLLSDGRTLMVGGEGRDGAARLLGGAAEPVDLARGPVHPRAWHTATVLPDGRVLIAGGVDRRGKSVSEMELFDPATGEFRDFPVPAAEPRSRHSATLLTDGTVLIAGGIGDDGSLADELVLLDPRTGIARDAGVRLSAPRRDASATLLADGSVIFAGGEDGQGNRPSFDERFDPGRSKLTLESSSFRETPSVPGVSFSMPADGESGVSPGVIIGLRLSERVRVESVNERTVVLQGPQGAQSVRVVAAEAGRLIFVTPRQPLLPDAAYRLSLDGISSADGMDLPAVDVRFTTGSPQEDDPESWIPDTRSGNWRSNRPASSWESMPPLHAREGLTALAGQVLTLDGKPLADVTLEIEGTSARTDHTGRFLITAPATGHQELLIDGRTASRPRRTYGIFEAGVELTEGKTNVLPYTIWMPRIDTDHQVTIPSPTGSEVVVTTPRIPGLEVHIPAGTVIVDHDGNVVREISITPIPVDRTPFPLPGVYVPIYFTIQPGGAYVQGYGSDDAHGIRIVYPNYRGEAPGSRLNFWYYEPSGPGWSVYGRGTVTPDGRQVMPDPGVAIHEFSGAMISGGGSPPATGPAPGGPDGGDPIDLSTGLFVSEQTDLVVDDVIPIVIRRVFRPGDPTVRAFGIGTNHPLGTFLYSANNYQEADLILPDGARIHYVRISPGTGNTDAVYEHTATPGRFYKSRIAWNNLGWDLTLLDGTVLRFDDMAPLQWMSDRYGNKLTLAHSNGVQGNITRATTPHGRYVDFTYDASNRITQVKDNLGRTVGYAYDASGRLSTITDAAGGISMITYDTSNRILTMKDARTNVFVTNQYDANGRVYRQTLANTGVYQFAYTLDVAGHVTQTDVTDPRGFIRRVTFTSVPAGAVNGGYPLTDTYAVGQPEARTFTYERQAGTNIVLSVTDPLGRRTAFTHDDAGNVTAVTRLAGTTGAVTTQIAWDPAWNKPTSITDPLSHVTSYGYDASGRLQSITNAEQEQMTLGYGADNQPTSVTFPGSHTFQLAYDYGDLIGITDPLGKTGSRFVDGAGRPARVTDAAGRWRQFEYSTFDQTTKITDPLGGSSVFAYDPNGNLLTATDPRLKVTTFTYDAMNWPLTRKDALNRTESFVFDTMGNLTKHTDRRGKVTTFTYDALGRRTFAGFGTTTQGHNTVYDSTVTYTYDAANRVRTVVDSLAGTQTLNYDDLDRLTSESGPRGTVTYTYDAADRRQTMTVTGQPAVTYSYDDANRLTQVTQGSSTTTITYDTSGRRATLTLPDGVEVDYGYDAASHVSGLTYRLGTNVLGDLAYDYDASGRRSRVSGSFARTTLPAALASAIYDATNEMTKRGTTNMTYDANGNLTGDGTNTYTWDARNQLATTAGGVAASFKYDGLGRRNERVVAGVTTRYLFDGFDPVQELSTTAPTANLLGGLETDERFLRTDAAGPRSFLTDILGNSVALADGAGALQTQYTYEPFGKSTPSGPASTSSYQFTGRDNDGTGLVYSRARYYSPTLQRFVSEDPLRFSGSDGNLYEYVSNDPINGTDPFGLWTFQLGLELHWSVSVGPIGLAWSYTPIGIAFDGEGNVATYTSQSMPAGVTVSLNPANWGGALGGISGGVGLQGLWSGNARTICDLKGAFKNLTVGGGKGLGGGVGDFGGTSPDGHYVSGWQGYAGLELGISETDMMTNTTIMSQVNVPYWLRNHAFGGN